MILAFADGTCRSAGYQIDIHRFHGKGQTKMKTTRVIKLGLDDVSAFVEAASHCDFEVDIANNSTSRYIVDAKSIVGVLGLDLSNKLVVTYDGYNEEFERFLEAMAIAC